MNFETIGREAFKAGEMRVVPMEILNVNGPEIGSSLTESRAWLKGWDSANLEEVVGK